MKKQVMRLVDKDLKPIQEEDNLLGFAFDPASIIDDGSMSVTVDVQEESHKKKRGRPRKDRSMDNDPTPFVPAKEKSPINSDMPYSDTYGMNMQMLAGTVMQIDDMNARVMQDLDEVRQLRKSFKKYEYIGMLSGTATGLVGNKISAIREMNSVITKCHDLELKRAKEIKGANDVDDDKKLMDMYSAFINAPTGAPNPNMPYTSLSQSALMSASAIAGGNDGFIPANDPGYADYERNLTPEQNAMLQEGNPNIETVVVYDQSTQDKYVEVIDTSTGRSVPNMPVPGRFILDGCTVDINRGIARNADFNQNFKLKLVGQRAMNEY